MESEQRGYHSYLLRLWQAGNGHAPEWRIVLEDVRTHARQSFASVDQLVTFLHAQIRDQVASGDTSTGSQVADDVST
jgi:hypothetical protein